MNFCNQASSHCRSIANHLWLCLPQKGQSYCRHTGGSWLTKMIHFFNLEKCYYLLHKKRKYHISGAPPPACSVLYHNKTCSEKNNFVIQYQVDWSTLCCWWTLHFISSLVSLTTSLWYCLSATEGHYRVNLWAKRQSLPYLPTNLPVCFYLSDPLAARVSWPFTQSLCSQISAVREYSVIITDGEDPSWIIWCYPLKRISIWVLIWCQSETAKCFACTSYLSSWKL